MSLPYLDTMLLYLDPQTRERVVRAAEDSIRAELRRVNVLLTEAIRDRVAAERARDDAVAELERLRADTLRPPPPCTGCGVDREGGPCSLCAAAMIGAGR